MKKLILFSLILFSQTLYSQSLPVITANTLIKLSKADSTWQDSLHKLQTFILSGVSTGGVNIQDEATPLTKRDTISFTGLGISATDQTTKTIVSLDPNLEMLSRFSTEIGFLARIDSVSAYRYRARTLNGSTTTDGGISVSINGGDGSSNATIISSPREFPFKNYADIASTTNINRSGNQTIDGVLTTNGTRVLLKNQTDSTQNGLYVLSSGTWSRPTDLDGSTEFDKGQIIYVRGGSTNSNTLWYLGTPAPITVNTTKLWYTQIPITSSGGTPAGASFQVQYNNSGAFGAEDVFNYDPTNNRLVVGHTTASATLHARGDNNTGSNVLLAESQAGDDIIYVRSNGLVRFGNHETYPLLKQTVSGGGSVNYLGKGLTMEGLLDATTGTDLFAINHPESDLSTGTYNILEQIGSWAPTSGTSNYNGITSGATLNITGTNSGTVNSFLAAPTVTNLASGATLNLFNASPTITAASGPIRGYFSNIASGTGRYQLLANGTAQSRFNGPLGVGIDPESTFEFQVSGNAKFNGRPDIQGVGNSILSDDATASLRFKNTTNSTYNWTIGTLNNDHLSIQSTNLTETVRIDSSGKVNLNYRLRVGATDSTSVTPTSLVGKDNSGNFAGVKIGTGLSLTSGELTATGGGGGGFTPNVNVYQTAGTYSLAIPPGAIMIEIVCIGAGGGGGSGRQADNGANRFGGGGGSAGGWSTTTIRAADVTGPLSVVVGAGGTGGAAITIANTNGNSGNNGTQSRVDSNTGAILVYAGPGNGGFGGTATSGAAGGVSSAGTDFGYVQGGAGSSTTGTAGNSTLNKPPSGGGGGGGLNASNTQSSGGAGGGWNYGRTTQTNQGTTSVPNAAAGGTPTQGQIVGGGGGGGGASQSAAAGGNGGAGTRGGGGGGGGASATGFNSGAGGNGGAGYVRVVFY